MKKVWLVVPDCSTEDEPSASEIVLKTYTCLHTSYDVCVDWIKLNMFNSLRYDDEHGDLSKNSIIVDTIFDILDIDKILLLIDNYKNNIDLLSNIDYDATIINILDKHIDTHIDASYVFLSFWIFNIFEFLYIAFKLKKYNKDIHLFAGGIQLSISVQTYELFSMLNIFDEVSRKDVDYTLKKFFPNEYVQLKQAEYLISPVNECAALFRTSSHGCLNNCPFCIEKNVCKIMPLKINLEKQFKYFKSINYKGFFINDTSINFNENFDTLCYVMDKYPPQMFGCFFMYLEKLTEYHANKLSTVSSLIDLSCSSIFFGVDIFRHHPFNNFLAYKKDMILEKQKELQILSKAEILFGFIYNLPYESTDVFKKFNMYIRSLDLSLIIDRLRMTFNNFAVFPGTEIYKNPGKFNLNLLENTSSNKFKFTRDITSKYPYKYIDNTTCYEEKRERYLIINEYLRDRTNHLIAHYPKKMKQKQEEISKLKERIRMIRQWT